jgi:hypothetical protein
MPTPAEIREWCLYFQSTWSRQEEQERAGSGARVRTVLREVRMADFEPGVADCVTDDR